MLFLSIFYSSSFLIFLQLLGSNVCSLHSSWSSTWTMSQSTTSDLVSTIATQLNIVIVALRLLVDMIQNPDATSPLEMTPGSCPSRPPASPISNHYDTFDQLGTL